MLLQEDVTFNRTLSRHFSADADADADAHALQMLTISGMIFKTAAVRVGVAARVQHPCLRVATSPTLLLYFQLY